MKEAKDEDIKDELMEPKKESEDTVPEVSALSVGFQPSKALAKACATLFIDSVFESQGISDLGELIYVMETNSFKGDDCKLSSMI